MIGSYISNLMCWRDLDVGLLVGPAYGPRDVLHLISRVMELPSYPDQVGGFEIYTAVVDDGVRTPEQFRRRLAGRGLPQI